MSANLKKVDVPKTLFEFFKQSDPNTNYLFKLKIRRDAYSTHYKEKWLAAKVVMNFNEGKIKGDHERIATDWHPRDLMARRKIITHPETEKHNMFFSLGIIEYTDPIETLEEELEEEYYEDE